MSECKKRKMNWSVMETTAMVEGYVEFSSIVDGKLSPCLTNTDKERCWSDLLLRVNAQSKCERTIEEIKKKLSDVKTNVKKRERERRRLMRQTGGGEHPTVPNWEKKILDVIGEVAIGGFSGVDTFLNAPETETHAVLKHGPEHVAPSSTSSTKQAEHIEDRAVPIVHENSPVIQDRAVPIVHEDSPVIQGIDGNTAKRMLDLLEKQNELLAEILQEQRSTNEKLKELFIVPLAEQ